jgi:hypothetical protein
MSYRVTKEMKTAKEIVAEMKCMVMVYDGLLWKPNGEIDQQINAKFVLLNDLITWAECAVFRDFPKPCDCGYQVLNEALEGK